MATIVTRAGKGSPLTNAEVDANFVNLNTDKLEANTTATLTNKTINIANNTLTGVQPTLVSGTSIKTVNSASLLGSGDIPLQTPLVSGTSIKTVNSASLLGSGDIPLQTPLVSGTSIKTINGTSVLGSGNIQIDGGVVSFNTRTGAVTLASSDVTTALGFTPYNATNPAGYTTNTGTVTSVGGTGSASGLTLTGTVTTSGSLTLGGTLAVTPSNFASQTANTVLAAPNGASGVPTFRALIADDIPTLNQNTTGTAANVTGIVAVANGGTGTATPSLVAGANVTISGTFPNQTINASGGGAGGFEQTFLLMGA